MIFIDKYEPVIQGGKIVYYAVAGDTRYEMPDCYKSMYNNNYLAIEEREMERPELYGAPKKHYMPLRRRA